MMILMCHVVRDNEGKEKFAGPRYMTRLASLEMHPMDRAVAAKLRYQKTLRGKQ